jgi:hypothetical protein
MLMLMSDATGPGPAADFSEGLPLLLVLDESVSVRAVNLNRPFNEKTGSSCSALIALLVDF